jgi:hypothetical protein
MGHHALDTIRIGSSAGGEKIDWGFPRRNSSKPKSYWNDPMDDRLTVAELEKRWKHALIMTQAAVTKQPRVYRELKSLAGKIITQPVDIKVYLPTVEKLLELLKALDPNGQGTIFHFFNDRIAPSSIWDVCWLRLECKDLLAHLEAFDQWRRRSCGLKIVK